VSERSGVAVSSIQRITNGTRTKARRETVDAILAVGRSAAHGTAPVPAGPTWERVNELLANGWTKKAIGQHLTGDPRTVSLQLNRERVTADNARKIEALHAQALRGVLRAREIEANRRAEYRRSAA
jgi:hypothetical protein